MQASFRCLHILYMYLLLMSSSIKKAKSTAASSKGRKRTGSKTQGRKGREKAKETEVNEITATLVKLTILGCFLGIVAYVIVYYLSGK